jgi:hypothetical protein
MAITCCDDKGAESNRGILNIFCTDASGVRTDDVEIFPHEGEEKSKFLVSLKPFLVGERFLLVQIDGVQVGEPIPISVKSSEVTASPPNLNTGNWELGSMVCGARYKFGVQSETPVSDAGISFLGPDGSLVQVAKHTIDCSEADSGRVNFTVVPNVPGTWSVIPTINGEPVLGAPFQATVTPSHNIRDLPTPQKFGQANATATSVPTVTGVDGLAHGRIGAPSAFLVTPHEAGLGPIEVTFKGPKGNVVFDTEVFFS